MSISSNPSGGHSNGVLYTALLNDNELYNMSAPGKKKRDRGSKAKLHAPRNPLPWQTAIESALTG
ncbi:hypothetical protein FRB94_010958 [Tulasnella sp. JGI-2019a]|nr:hypothetical protein FRB94_010958 [Tulasnella sp. JGI-2019a]